MQRVKRLSWGLACLLSLSLGVGAGAQNPNLTQILEELRDLKRTVAEQQKEIAALRARLDRQEHAAPRTAAVTPHARGGTRPAPKVQLGPNIDRLKVRGDFFVRYETRTNDTGKPGNPKENRDRLRSRLRLGLVWTNKQEDWELGVGLATGTLVGHGCTDTWSEKEIFETDDLRLDYAYGRHVWGPLTLTLGQQKNPFYTTQMLWDKDYRPAGFTARLDAAGAFATLGYYDVLWGPNLKKDNDDADVSLYALQIGKNWRLGERTRLLTAVSAYLLTDSFHDATPRKNDAYDPFKHSPGLYLVGDDYHIRLGDVYAQLQTRAGPVGLKFYFQAAKNFGANGNVSQQTSPAGIDPGDNDFAWLLGCDARYGKIKLRYWYTRIEADSVFGPLKFDTYGAGAGLTDTNIAGHYAGIFYSLTPHLSLAVKAMLLGQIEGTRNARLYQFDVKYVF